MKEAVTKVIDMLTQKDFHVAYQKLLERYKKGNAAGGDYFAGDYAFMCVLSIKVPIRKSLEIHLIILVKTQFLLWTPSPGRAKAGRPARTYIQKLFEDTRCNPEDLPEAMNDREVWRDRFRDIRAGGTTRWWWEYSLEYSFNV